MLGLRANSLIKEEHWVKKNRIYILYMFKRPYFVASLRIYNILIICIPIYI